MWRSLRALCLLFVLCLKTRFLSSFSNSKRKTGDKQICCQTRGPDSQADVFLLSLKEKHFSCRLDFKDSFVFCVFGARKSEQSERSLLLLFASSIPCSSELKTGVDEADKHNNDHPSLYLSIRPELFLHFHMKNRCSQSVTVLGPCPASFRHLSDQSSFHHLRRLLLHVLRCQKPECFNFLTSEETKSMKWNWFQRLNPAFILNYWHNNHGLNVKYIMKAYVSWIGFWSPQLSEVIH